MNTHKPMAKRVTKKASVKVVKAVEHNAMLRAYDAHDNAMEDVRKAESDARGKYLYLIQAIVSANRLDLLSINLRKLDKEHMA